MKEALIKVKIDFAPKGNGKRFAAWCAKWGCDPLNGGRRAWCSPFNTYLRDDVGVATTESGESFLVCAEDILDNPLINPLV